MFEPDILLCRLCRKSSGPYVDIFNPKGTKGLIVWKVIKDLIQLDVSKDDMLPNAICKECMDKVAEFRNFKTMCINSRIEFLKASASVGLIEVEPGIQPTKVPERNSMTPSMTVVHSTCTSDSQSGHRWSGEEPATAQFENMVYCVSGVRQDEGQRGHFNVVGDSRSPVNPTEPVINTPSSFQRPEVEVDLDPFAFQGVQIGMISEQSIKADHSSVSPQKDEDVTSQYLERRLDEGIGDLKHCDAPNCRKVFSSYKALVVHKKTKHLDLCSNIGDHADRKLGRATVPSEPETTIRIAEFPCTQPSCDVRFSNLSSLLSHQAGHAQQQGGGLRGSVSSLDEVVSLSGDGDVDARSHSSNDDCVEKEGETTPSVRPPVQVVAPAGLSGGCADDPADSSNANEPEFMCHWVGCGKGFLSFEKLLNHRKRKHSTDRGVCAPVKRPKQTRKSQAETSSGNAKDLKGVSKAFACPLPGCGKSFDTLRYLNVHRSRIHLLRSKNWNPKKKSEKYSSGAKDGQEGSLNVKGEEVRVKEEPEDKVNGDGSEQGQSGLEGQSSSAYVGDHVEDAFECESPGCQRVFPNFKGLQAHFLQKHRPRKACMKVNRSSKCGRR